MNDVETKQKKEKKELDRVATKLKTQFDPVERDANTDPSSNLPEKQPKKPDFSAYKTNLAKIEAEEEARENEKEAY